MSMPPQLIRVKRKRVEEAPVTFLQFDQGSKRHRSGSNWAYQRRQSTTQRTPDFDSKPVIHVSKPGEASPPAKKRQEQPVPAKAEQIDQDVISNLEPRRFRVSKAMLARAASAGRTAAGVTKKGKYGPTVFVEATRKLKIPKTRRSLAASQVSPLQDTNARPASPSSKPVSEERQLKKPGVANRARAENQEQRETPSRAPLPESLMNRHPEDMDKIATDMNQWVLNEIGASLHSMEQEKQAQAARFKPKAPVQRYQERHPELVPLPVQQPPPDTASDAQVDTAMGDASDEEDDDEDWIIEEYIRIPAKSVALDVSPGDVGILVLDEEEENMLFFGSAADDDDELAEDEEDENAENHYTADYPEDEVESDDEYGRQAYGYRYGNNSDDEEFDNEYYEEQDEMVLEGDADDDDDARMARIRDFMRRNRAFG